MYIIIGLFGCLQMIGGIFIWLAAKSAIHEILAAALFGFGTLCWGQSAIIQRLSAPKAKEPIITPANQIVNPKVEPTGGWVNQ